MKDKKSDGHCATTSNNIDAQVPNGQQKAKSRNKKKKTKKKAKSQDDLLSAPNAREGKTPLHMLEPALEGSKSDDKQTKVKSTNIPEGTIEEPNHYGTMKFETPNLVSPLKDDLLSHGWWYKVYAEWRRLICW